MTAVPPPLYVFVHGWGYDSGLWAPLRAALERGVSPRGVRDPAGGRARGGVHDTVPLPRPPGPPAVASDAGGVAGTFATTFATTLAIDLGFFGAPTEPPLPEPLPAHRGLIAVGHSFGLLWLLHQMARGAFPVPDGLVSISGFPRFTEAPDYAPAVPRRQLVRMITRLDAAPLALLEEFRHRCGTIGAVSVPIPPGLDAGRLAGALRALRDWDLREQASALRLPVLGLAGGADPIVPPEMTEHALRTFHNVRLEWDVLGGHLLPLTAPLWCAAHLHAFAGGVVAAR